MRVHVIRDGVVVNTILVIDLGVAADQNPAATVIEATQGGPGWLWDGETLSPPMPPPPPVPAEVTNFQARAALRAAGLLASVQAAIGSASDEAQDAWQYANFFTRHGTLVNAIGAGLGLTDAQIDELFRTAATIEA